MVENELKVFVLKSLSNDPVLINNLIKVYFEDSVVGTTVGLQLGGSPGLSPYLVDVAFKENDVFSVRVYTDNFYYLKKTTLSGELISTLPNIIQETANRIITYLKITGFNLNEDYYG